MDNLKQRTQIDLSSAFLPGGAADIHGFLISFQAVHFFYSFFSEIKSAVCFRSFVLCLSQRYLAVSLSTAELWVRAHLQAGHVKWANGTGCSRSSPRDSLGGGTLKDAAGVSEGAERMLSCVWLMLLRHTSSYFDSTPEEIAYTPVQSSCVWIMSDNLLLAQFSLLVCI